MRRLSPAIMARRLSSPRRRVRQKHSDRLSRLPRIRVFFGRSRPVVDARGRRRAVSVPTSVKPGSAPVLSRYYPNPRRRGSKRTAISCTRHVLLRDARAGSGAYLSTLPVSGAPTRFEPLSVTDAHVAPAGRSHLFRLSNRACGGARLRRLAGPRSTPRIDL